MKFRNDINGLRAIAVISVVLFHFNNDWLPGGFVGVDVFFVISGFLMTSIIFRGFENNNFKLSSFFVSRVNRILPALIVLCASLLIFGWFFLSPIDYRPLSAQVVSSLAFVSNVFFWRESGYFDSSSTEKWLLHTWSLSVEWQFYVLYPLVLVALKRWLSIERLKALLLISTFITFILCVYASYRWTEASYFLLPTRAWEMLLGGVAFLYPFKLLERHGKWLVWLGIVMIALAYMFVSKHIIWPGYIALLPVVGAYIILMSNNQKNFLLNNTVSQKIGKWSYSIYLWHWPVVVANTYLSFDMWWLFGIPLSIFLGYFSYRFVESQQLIEGKRWGSLVLSKPVLANVILLLISISVFLSNGALFRLSDEEKVVVLDSISAQEDRMYPKPNKNIDGLDIRFIPGRTDKNILFVGASHIEHTYPYAIKNSEKYNIYYLTMGGCFLTESMENPKWSCSNLKDYKRLFDHVEFEKVVTSLYCFYCYVKDDSSQSVEENVKNRTNEYNHFLKFAKEKSKEVIIILGEPVGETFNPKLSVRHQLPDHIPVSEARDTFKVHYEAMKRMELDQVEIIDPIDFLCTDICPTKLNGKFAYSDQSHFRPFYAEQKLTYLAPIFD